MFKKITISVVVVGVLAAAIFLFVSDGSASRDEGPATFAVTKGEIIDKAVRSRITMWVDYPPLQDESRMQIWKTLFEAAGIDYSQRDIPKLSELRLNGREIRSIVRLIKLRYGDRTVYFEDVQRTAKFRPQFDSDEE